MSAPSISKSTGSFFRKGKCEVCGKGVERSKTFVASSYEQMMKMGEAWSEPLRHKKCEYLPLPSGESK